MNTENINRTRIMGQYDRTLTMVRTIEDKIRQTIADDKAVAEIDWKMLDRAREIHAYAHGEVIDKIVR